MLTVQTKKTYVVGDRSMGVQLKGRVKKRLVTISLRAWPRRVGFS